MKTALVTGASTGIGAACVKLLIDNGFFVFAAVRNDADAAKIAAQHGAAAEALLFDVTDAAAVAAAVARVSLRLNGATLSGLVNNAGVATPGPLLHLPIEEVRRQIDINVIGQLQVTQAFAPLLGAGAAARSGPKGRIVNMSSVSGRFASPFLGAYAASKSALEALSDALRRELMIYGVDVILIEPGMIATPIWDKAEQADFARFDDTVYGPAARRMVGWAVSEGRAAPGPEKVAQAVLRALTAARPPARIPVVKRRFLDYTLLNIMPARLADWLLARRLGFIGARAARR